MKTMVIGSGGREHALTWRLLQSEAVEKVIAVPGNGGMGKLAECVGDVSLDPASLADLAEERRIDLTVVGPEAILVAGVADEFSRRGLALFGPTQRAAAIEGSKSFAKELMLRHGIPTGWAEVFTDYDQAAAYIETVDPPYVIKADGLAAGKGVFICQDVDQAKEALSACLVEKRFGEAGSQVLVEEFLAGEELSVMALVDGETVVPMTPAQDYKRVFDGDKGPNTGGMGSYSPVASVGEELSREIVDTILKPTAKALRAEGITYQGVLYAGLMLTKAGPRVMEFNCRFGDPETQAIMPRYQGNLADLLGDVVGGRLAATTVNWSEKKCVSVVMASEGYPENPVVGRSITGLEKAEALDDVMVFHAGTRLEGGRFYTTGGRVLNVSALGGTFREAADKAYEAVGMIQFEGAHFRRDIAGSAANAD